MSVTELTSPVTDATDLRYGFGVFDARHYNHYDSDRYGNVFVMPKFTPAQLGQYDASLASFVEMTGTIYGPNLTPVDIVGDMGRLFTSDLSESYLAVAGRVDTPDRRVVLMRVSVPFEPNVVVMHPLVQTTYAASETGDDVKYHSPATATFRGRERRSFPNVPANEAARGAVYIHFDQKDSSVAIVGRSPHITDRSGKPKEGFSTVRVFVRQVASSGGTYKEGVFLDTLGTDMVLEYTRYETSRVGMTMGLDEELHDGKLRIVTVYDYEPHSTNKYLNEPEKHIFERRRQELINTGNEGDKAVQLLPGSVLRLLGEEDGPVLRVDNIHPRGLEGNRRTDPFNPNWREDHVEVSYLGLVRVK